MNVFKRIKKIHTDVRYLRGNLEKPERFCSYMGGGVALTQLWDGTKVFVDTFDRSVAPHLMMSGEWEIDITKVFMRFLPESGVLFDCGANHGYFGLLAMAKSQCDVHFFEVNEKLAELVRDSASINGWHERAVIVRNAVSARTGELVEVAEPSGYAGSAKIGGVEHRLCNEDTTLSRKYTVETTALDDYCDEHSIDYIDFMKLDVESHEEQALVGAEAMLRGGRIRKLLMEYTVGAYSESFVEMLTDSFARVSVVDNSGELIEVRGNQDIELLSKEWAMLYCEV